MLLPHGTVIALVDGQNFELFRNSGNEAEAELEAVTAPQLNASNHSGTGHHSSPGNHAGSLVAEDAHAMAATEWLNAEVLGHKLENLVIIASPRTLGEMRRHYHKALEGVLRAELAKDLSGRNGPEILAALKGK